MGGPWAWVTRRYLARLALGSHDWRPRFVVASLAFAELVLVVLMVVCFAVGNRTAAMVLAAFGVAALLLLEASRHLTRALAAHATLATTAATMAALLWLEPALDSGMLLWLGMLPVLATLVQGSRPGALWLAVAAAMAAVAWAVKGPPTAAPDGALHATRLASFVVTVFVFMVLFDLSRLRAIQAAQAATRAKSAFLATMSHEIRTPMNGVLGMTEVMLHEDPRPEQREQLTIIQRSGQLLVALINDILDLSKVEADKLTLDARPFELRALLDEVTQLHAAQASRRGVALTLRTPDELPREVVGDALRLRQVLGNLLGNAVKFTERGWVELRVRPGAGASLHFEVDDTGVGISPEGLARLFQPFQQVDASASRRFQGTGLGLALAGQLVRLMGGRLGVRSTLGRGSTFEFDAAFPEVTAAATPVKPLLAPAMAAGVRRVLIVDDNAVNLTVASALVRKLGFEVELARDGAEAVDAVTQRPYALVLMDCHMPGEDGFSATTRIRALPGAAAQVPIVALTASAMVEELEQCRLVGMDDCLTKPLVMARLQEVLARFGGPAAGAPHRG